ncbi:hypothetical protein B5E80_05875 [Flavonifractor sp. An135]|nr:permease prefix domain 1-containing protein [Flavonifractor sp. An135]OUQ24974.1 hypothetical protein B5E80_05875 [Flavonifractor sp. An135]
MTIPDYCAAVCRFVRFSPDHAAITAELTAHLEDAVEARESRGVPHAQVVVQAVDAMGAPAEVGKALDALHSPLLGWVQIWVRRVLVLCAVLMLLPTLTGLWTLSKTFVPQEHPAQWQSTQTGEALPGLPIRNAAKHSGYTLSLWDGVRDGDTVALLVRLEHFSPWLRSPSEWAFQSLTVTDNVGSTYINWATAQEAHLEEFQVYASSNGRYDTFFSTYFTLTVYNVPPEADILTFTLAQSGEPFSFSLPLNGGDGHA